MTSTRDTESSLDSLHSVESRSTQHDAPQILRNENVEDEPNSNNLTSSVSRIKSNASSKKSNSVPIKDRRGLLSQITIIPEYHDARDYPPKIKLTLIFIIAFAAITGPMGTSIMLPAIDDVADNLHTSVSVVNVSVGIYLLSLGIFPLWWSALSERLGRRSIYVTSFVLFCCFSIGAALSKTIGSLIAFRVLSGGCSASVQAVGAGTVSDLYSQEERGFAMGIYYLGPLMGPFLAPILGGVVSQVWGWRATQWLMVIFSGCNVVLILFGLPETLRLQDNMAAIKDILQRREAGIEEEKEQEKEPEKEVGNGNENKSEKEKENSQENISRTRSKGNSMNDIDSSPYQSDESQIDDQHKKVAQTKEVSDSGLKKIASNSSRRSYRSYLQRDDEESVEAPIVDAIMPTLSRLTTSRSMYNDPRVTSTNLPGIDKQEAEKELDEVALRESNWKMKTYDFVVRPLHSLNLLRYPPVALAITFSSINFCVIYFFNMTISSEYSKDPYNFKSIIIGLLYIPNSVTYVLASVVGGKWIDNNLRRYVAKHGVAHPESRLSWNLVVAIGLVPPACLIFGWCLNFGEHWVTPLIGSALFGFASMIIIGATVTYLVDTLPGRGATGVALNNFVRMILAAMATFVVDSALTGIGPGKLFSILMAIQLFMVWTLLIVKFKGQYFRDNYDLSKYYNAL